MYKQNDKHIAGSARLDIKAPRQELKNIIWVSGFFLAREKVTKTVKNVKTDKAIQFQSLDMIIFRHF